LTCYLVLEFILCVVSCFALGFLFLLEPAVVFVYPRQEGPYKNTRNSWALAKGILQTNRALVLGRVVHICTRIILLTGWLAGYSPWGRAGCSAGLTLGQLFLACAPLQN